MMKFLYIIAFFIYFLNIIHNITAYKPRIYIRIPQHFVHDRVIQFLNTNRKNNCFEFEESPTNLLLKCWRENQLVNVDINIDRKYQQKYLLESFSI